MKIHVPQGEGSVSGMVCGIFGIWACIGFNRRNDAEKCIRLVCEKLTVFPCARYTVDNLNSVSNSFSYDIVRFKIEVGIEEKFMCKHVSKQTQHAHCDSSDNTSGSPQPEKMSYRPITLYKRSQRHCDWTATYTEVTSIYGAVQSERR